MLIDKNIQKILGGGYNVSEVKYMDKTVWSSGAKVNITISKTNNDVLRNVYIQIESEEFPHQAFKYNNSDNTYKYSYTLLTKNESIVVKIGKVQTFGASIVLNGMGVDSFAYGEYDLHTTMVKLEKNTNNLLISIT